MSLNLDRCLKCKYNYYDWCSKRASEVGDVPGGIHCCVECPMNMDNADCHCLNIVNADECDRFEPKED